MLDLLPRPVGTMATYPPLNKALVIDPSGELRDFLRFCAARLWPNLQIISYLWARGCPNESYEWAGFDLVVLEQRLHNRQAGLDWLRAMRQNPAAPAIVLVSGEPTETLQTEARHAGAAAVLDKNDLSPRRFAECVDRVLRGSVPDADSALPEPHEPPPDAAEPSEPAAPAATTAPQVPGFQTVQPIATLDRGCLSLATDESNGRTVALKIVRLTTEMDPAVLRRFEHEYGALSALKHANVITIYKHGVVENCVFIAMEYCTGGDLEERIERGTSMEDAVDYLVQIMRGLEAVHARGVLHRDLKPTNLLFRENGTLVLTDFGIERDISDNPRLTSTRSLVSDLSYVSPESIRRGTVDPRSDLYSAGVIFYHALTGTVPFESPNVTTMLEAHLNAPIPRLPRSVAILQPLIDGLLEKRPDDRFQSAAEVLDGIEWLTAASV